MMNLNRICRNTKCGKSFHISDKRYANKHTCCDACSWEVRLVQCNKYRKSKIPIRKCQDCGLVLGQIKNRTRCTTCQDTSERNYRRKLCHKQYWSGLACRQPKRHHSRITLLPTEQLQSIVGPCKKFTNPLSYVGLEEQYGAITGEILYGWEEGEQQCSE